MQGSPPVFVDVGPSHTTAHITTARPVGAKGANAVHGLRATTLCAVLVVVTVRTPRPSVLGVGGVLVVSALAVATSVFVAATIPSPITLAVDGLRAVTALAVCVVVAVWAALSAIGSRCGVHVVPALLAAAAASVASPGAHTVGWGGAAAALAVCVVVAIRAVRSSVGSRCGVHVVLALLAAAAVTIPGPVSCAVHWLGATRGRALLLSSRCAQKTPAVVSGLLKTSSLLGGIYL